MAYDIRPHLYSATQPEDEGYLARRLQNLQLSLLRHSLTPTCLWRHKYSEQPWIYVICGRFSDLTGSNNNSLLCRP